MSDQHKNQKLVVIAGILAIGLLAASLAGSQLLNATAQTSNGSKTVTSIDNIDCSKQYSSVHCVGGPTALPDKGASTASSNGSQVVSSNMNCENPSSVDCVIASKATISTFGTAATKVDPDKFTVTVGVETNGTTAQQAASLNANMTDKIVKALKGLGIADNDISTSSYNVFPIYGNNNSGDKVCIDIYPQPPNCQPNQNIIGYRASNSLSVTLDVGGNIDSGKVIDTAIKAGANNVNGVFFFLSQEKQQQVRDSLIKDAIANARHRADVAADALGMQVSGVQSVNLNDIYFPIPYSAMTAAPVAASGSNVPTQILPGEQDVTATINIVYFMSTVQTGGVTNSTDQGAALASERAVAIARQFILSKLPSLGITIDNEFKLHSDQVVALTESEYQVQFSVMDQDGQSHSGQVQISNGEVTNATMDGKSIL